MNNLLKAFLVIAVFNSCNDAEKTVSNDETIKQLTSPVDSVSAEPYLFTDKNGLVYLSWIEKAKDISNLKFSVLNNDSWSTPNTISSGNNWFVNWADYPMLAADGAGSVVAHFLEKSEDGKYTYDVRLVTSNNKGNTWDSSKVLHDDGKKAEHGFVSMVLYNDGYFISWLDGRNTVSEKADTSHHAGHHGAMSLRAAIVDKEGNKTSEWELDNKVCDCCQTSAALTANGPVVIYRDRSDAEIRDISIVRLIDGKWTAPQTIFPDQWKIEGCPVNGPRIAAEGNNLAIAWFTSPDKKAQVNIIFSQDGGASFNKPIRIDEENAIGRVDVVMLDEKSAMVSWMEGAVIKAMRVDKDGKKDAAVVIASSSESRSSGFPQMTKAGNRIIFAWSDDKDKTIKVAELYL